MKRIFSLIFAAVAAIPALWVNAAPAAPKAEIRAVWLTTNGNLDWPSSSNRSNPAAQQQELCNLLDKLAQANFNTIVFQAQVKGDVAWQSSYQPAMYPFTGNGSKELSYDVSKFVIDECHKRDMVCHAWIVPYRIGSASEASKYKSNPRSHLIYQHPEWCFVYNNSYYLDPGLPQVRSYLLDLYRELIANYDFDGISFDYTRYPNGSGIDDAKTYAAYNPDGLTIEDWRRQNINTFIAEFYDMAKEVNPDICVGAAPIGTYKNLPGYGNMTAFGVYQDACQWMKSGHHDLLIPQLYYNERYGFTPNLELWTQNVDGRTLAVGLAPYKMIDGTNDWEPSEVYNQIEIARGMEGVSGVCFFRALHITGPETKIQTLYKKLKLDYFSKPAHFPSMEHMGVTSPSAPTGVQQIYIDGEYTITWNQPDEADRVRYHSVYITDGTSVELDNPNMVAAYKVHGNSLTYKSSNPDLKFAVTAFDKGFYESAPAFAASTGIGDYNLGYSSISFAYHTLQVNGDRQIDRIDIFALDGAVAMSVNVAQPDASVDCTLLNRGLYIARVTYADGGTAVKKIMR